MTAAGSRRVALVVALAGAAWAAGGEGWDEARRRGAIHAECGRNARRLLQGWIDRKRDPQTSLYSRGGRWDYHNEAADHYSSLVLVAFYVAPDLIRPGATLHETLASSQRLCGTPSGIPTTYDLRAHAPGKPASRDALAEWLRDGLLRIVEVLGTENDWYRELERLTDAVLAEARRRGGMPTAFRDHESAGNMLQVLARLYAFSGKAAYLDSAEELAGAFLLDPARAIGSIRFGDHGCELVPGLAELFVVGTRLGRPKAASWREPLRGLLDGILASGAHPETGLFRRGNAPPPDTWGYVLFSFENADRATGEGRYRAAIEKPLRWLIANRASYPDLKSTLWPRSGSSDDWSDSYESFIVLWNRFRHIGGGFEWLDWATHQHIHRRHADRPYGPYTGGHFDGSTARTLCLHMMLCSQGVRCVPFAEGVGLGAVQRDGRLLLTVEAKTGWTGRLCFDGPRTEHKGATLDWARINEMPQWFVVRPDARYSVSTDGGPAAARSGRELLEGLRIEARPAILRRVEVSPVPRE